MLKLLKAKVARRLNSFKKQITVFSNTGDFVFKVLTLLMITKTFRAVIHSCETHHLSFQKLCKHKNCDYFVKIGDINLNKTFWRQKSPEGCPFLPLLFHFSADHLS